MDAAPDASGAEYDPPTNTLRPTTDATLTVRVIKSLTYRNFKPLVLQHLDLEATTVGQLKDRIRDGAREARWRRLTAAEVATKPAFKPYRTAAFGALRVAAAAYRPDTLKIYTHAHGAKVRRSLCLR